MYMYTVYMYIHVLPIDIIRLFISADVHFENNLQYFTSFHIHIVMTIGIITALVILGECTYAYDYRDYGDR